MLETFPTTHHFVIADDDKNMRYLMRRIIANRYPAARIFEAGDGREALKLHEEAGPDLMIIDHRLPLLDGVGLVRALRAQKVTIPLVMVSSDTAVQEEAAMAGASGFLDKKDLVRTLGNFLAATLPA